MSLLILGYSVVRARGRWIGCSVVIVVGATARAAMPG
jgi:hypothetical protein